VLHPCRETLYLDFILSIKAKRILHFVLQASSRRHGKIHAAPAIEAKNETVRMVSATEGMRREIGTMAQAILQGSVPSLMLRILDSLCCGSCDVK
jgi:hypothetical protein